MLGWNVFQHFYPYFDVVGSDWNERLAEGGSSSAPLPSTRVYSGKWDVADAALTALGAGPPDPDGSSPRDRVEGFWRSIAEAADHGTDDAPSRSAMAMASLGRKQEAIAWLARAVQREGASVVPYLGVLPVFEELRETPEFQALVARFGPPRTPA